MPDSTAPAGQGPRTRVRPYRYEDADEFAALARDSRALHHPWLFPPLTPEAYRDYAGGVIEDPTKAGFLVCELTEGHPAGGGRIAGSSTSTTSSGAASSAEHSATAPSPTPPAGD